MHVTTMASILALIFTISEVVIDNRLRFKTSENDNELLVLLSLYSRRKRESKNMIMSHSQT